MNDDDPIKQFSLIMDYISNNMERLWKILLYLFLSISILAFSLSIYNFISSPPSIVIETISAQKDSDGNDRFSSAVPSQIVHRLNEIASHANTTKRKIDVFHEFPALDIKFSTGIINAYGLISFIKESILKKDYHVNGYISTNLKNEISVTVWGKSPNGVFLNYTSPFTNNPELASQNAAESIEMAFDPFILASCLYSESNLNHPNSKDFFNKVSDILTFIINKNTPDYEDLSSGNESQTIIDFDTKSRALNLYGIIIYNTLHTKEYAIDKLDKALMLTTSLSDKIKKGNNIKVYKNELELLNDTSSIVENNIKLIDSADSKNTLPIEKFLY